MPAIQEIIHRIEEGVWARWMKLVTAVLAVAAIAVWYDLRQFRNFGTAEAMESAQLARNLAQGEGFTTHCIRPLSLYLIEKQQGVGARLSRHPHPDIVTPPVYPLVLAGLMKVLPFHYDIGPGFARYQPEMIIAVFNQLLLCLVAFLTYLLARSLFDQGVAAVSAALVLGSELLWRFTASGLSTTLLLAVFTAVAGLLVRIEQGTRDEGRSAGWFATRGFSVAVLLALGALTRYSFGWLVIPVLGFCALYLGNRRALVCGVIAGAFLLAMAPWLARNYSVSGTLFGVAGYAIHQDTPPFPEARLERTMAPDLGKIELEDYFRKVAQSWAPIVSSELPKYGGNWVGAFFLVGLLLPFRNPAIGRLRSFTLACLATFALAQGLGHTHLSTDSPEINSENLLVITCPVGFMFGVAFFFVLLDQVNFVFPELRRAAIIGFVAIMCLPLILILPRRGNPIAYPPYLPPWTQEASRFLETNELMMSDMPWAVGWYGDRNCVWAPVDARKGFYTINDEQKAISALYLTSLTLDGRLVSQVLHGEDWEWSRFAMDVMLRTNLPTGFPLLHARSGYLPEQLLLCDRPRWNERRAK